MMRHPSIASLALGNPLRTALLTALVLAGIACGDKEDDTAFPDLDGDGWSAMRGDCDDQDPEVHPDAIEICDDLDVDEDCNELADDDDPEVLASSQTLWFPDADGDGYASDEASGSLSCDPPDSSAVLIQGDCDDSDEASHPDATEICDGEDNDCDGLADDDDDSLDTDTTTAWYADADGDGFGDPDIITEACEHPSGTVADGTDCDDTDAAINPDAQEICDDEDIDQDCDTWADDIDPSTDRDTRSSWYADNDRDGFGDPDSVTEACDQPDWYVAPSEITDCDDTDAAINPDAQEICDVDNVDEDCDGLADDDDDSVDASGLSSWFADADGDGFGDSTSSSDACDAGSGLVADATDCDDTDAAINPDAAEYCNDIDDDCDALVDEDDAVDVIVWYLDADSDSYGDSGHTDIDCDQPTGMVEDATDCDDADAAINPDAVEICDSVDNDCDALVDEDDPDLADAGTWYTDADADGFGDTASPESACTQPSGTVEVGDDCDDADASVNPDASELCDGVDNDCDGTTDEDEAIDAATWYADADADGYGDADSAAQACTQPTGFVADSSDCDDADAAQFPGGDEVCNGEDDDCDGTADEDEAIDVATWYADTDGDSYGDPANTDIDCDQPTGFVADATEADCDDGDASQHPGADEVCNGEDDDCDGTTDEDEAVDVLTWYADVDSDGFGDPTSTDDDCDQPTGFVANRTDCDDTDASQYPGADEVCNGEDDDCDGTTDEDEAVDVATWFADVDGDGFGDAASTDIDCDQPTDYVGDATDCDDSQGAVNPDADEVCNGQDDDCDGDTDEDEAIDVNTWYADVDHDKFGDATSTDINCDQPVGFVADATDCDDNDDTQNPDADEVCNGEDDDCDGDVDEDSAVDVLTWYADSDSDSYGDAASADIDCDQPTGFVADNTDCDDDDASQHPGADEVCNGEDDDCDGDVDEDSAVDVLTWYADTDGDTFGDAASADIDCDQPTGFVADNTDCDDGDAAQYPGAPEHCNGEDDDCDGSTDEDSAVDVLTWYADTDADTFGDATSPDIDCDQPTGYVADNTDCDDDDDTQHPGADEHCNGEDDDCDGSTDEDSAVDVLTWYADTDGDTFGDATSSDIDCDQPTGFVAGTGDCDDTRADVNPSGQEICDEDNADEDCDGRADDADSSVDASTRTTWYRDIDGDGVGSASAGMEGPLCDHSSGYVPDDGDCDETSTTVHAQHDEICDTVDNDCDAGTSEYGVISVGSTAYTSLAAAVAAAGSGEEVMLCDGTHSAAVTTSVPLTLRSLNGAEHTTLDGGGSGTVITMGDDLVLDGLTLTGGAGITGGAIDGSVGGTAALTVTDCLIYGNEASSGGGIYAYDLDMTITGSEVYGNVATAYGGGLYVAGGSDLELGSMEIQGNEAVYGGGAYFEDLVITGGGFHDNFADYGGGMYLSGGSSSGAEIEVNLATSSGGGVALDDAAELLGALVQLNLAQSGGGVAVRGDDCRIGAAADGGAGTGITLNEATVYGGGVSGFSVTGTVIEDTSVTDNLAYYGGGVYLQSAGTVEASALTVTGNEVSNTGGGLYIVDVSDVTLADLELSTNWAGSSGGGGMIDGCTGAMVVTTSSITDNHAGSLGGGFYLVDVADADFTAMTLERNEGMGRQGGGFYLDSGVMLYATGSFGSGADANTPDDIGLTGRSYSYSAWADCDSDHLSCTGG
jgi:hypothetical protein